MSGTATAVEHARPATRSMPVKALTCTAAVALMLGATRWGSYIGVSPLFLTDLLILGSVVDRFVARRVYRDTPERRDGFVGSPSLVLVAFLVYTVVRMLFSGSWVLSVVWIRDGAPYLYAALALISADAVSKASAPVLERTMRWIWVALTFHLVWVCLVGPLSADSVFSQPRPLMAGGIFYGKPDIDSAILGVMAGLLLRRLFLGQRRGLAVLGLCAIAYGVSANVNRAGFISVVLACTAALGFAYSASGRAALKRLAILAMVPTAVLVAVTFLPQTTVGARLIATVHAGDSASEAAQNAEGTADARRRTWSGVVDWTTSTQSRTTFGAGMGVDFLAESGTLQYLEGTEYTGVRSPHDYFVGTFARLGVVGLGLIVALLLQVFSRMIRFRKRIAEDELLTFASLLIIALIPVASLGVVLEAPFGAVPFWWCAGLLLALAPLRSGEDAQAGEPAASTTDR